MKNLIIILIIVLGLSSCNKEEIKLNGKFKNEMGLDSYLVVKMKSLSNGKERVLDTIDIKKGEFIFSSECIKPPVKLTFMCPDSSEFDVWVGEYGTKKLEVKKDPLFEVKMFDSFFCDELQRMNKNLYKMYIYPIKKKELNVARLVGLANIEKLSEQDESSLNSFKKDIKMAYRLRKKSILKMVRKNKQNPVAVALMCLEYERLTSYQKKECLKYLSESFSDTGLNRQMKH